MKRTIIIALVGALLLGLVHIGLSTQSSAAPPQEPAAEGPVLVTIAENLILEPGDTVSSGYADVKSFRLFKLYARTPYVSETPPAVRVRVHESPLGSEGEGSYGSPEADFEWKARGVTTPRWVIASSFDGLYSKMRVWAKNEGETQVTISLYALMAEE